MTSLFQRTTLQEAFAALRRDLLDADGPRISTMRNYRFGIVPYDPSEELKLRVEVQKLSNELIAGGWVVLTISLQKLFFDRVRAQGSDWAERVSVMEKRQTRERAMNYLRDRLAPLIEGNLKEAEEGKNGIATDCGRLIQDFARRHPDKADRTLALLGRAGALYPFFRSSALLKHLDGKTANVPVVLLYPGEQRGPSQLSFMGMIEPDSDYRPRIYGLRTAT